MNFLIDNNSVRDEVTKKEPHIGPGLFLYLAESTREFRKILACEKKIDSDPGFFVGLLLL